MRMGLIAATALATTCWASPAFANGTNTEELEAELAEMRAQMAQMADRMAALESELAATKTAAAEASQQADEAAAAAAEASEKAESGVDVSWKGAPEFEGEGGWSFKPRGRIQADAGTISAPDGTGDDGFGSEIRRARLGVEGDIPGGFGYKFEVEFAGNDVEVADAILTYSDGGLKVSAGQHNNFQSMEELTSSRFTSFMERAAFTDAFGFERRLGLSGEYAGSNFLVQAGVFSDSIGDLPDGSRGADGRIVFFPKTGDAQLHFGGSVHFTDFDDGGTIRYRQRPFVHFTGARYVNTGNFAADSETGYGLEAAGIIGRFHAAGEAFWQSADMPGAGDDPIFFGGYVEAGVFLTDDTRGYKKGVFDRVKPNSPVGEGGMGAFQVNVRYDHLDLNDAMIVGGTQDTYAISLIWTPTDYTRFMLNYGRNDISDAAIPATGGETDYTVDAFGVRAQVDF